MSRRRRLLVFVHNWQTVAKSVDCLTEFLTFIIERFGGRKKKRRTMERLLSWDKGNANADDKWREKRKNNNNDITTNYVFIDLILNYCGRGRSIVLTSMKHSVCRWFNIVINERNVKSPLIGFTKRNSRELVSILSKCHKMTFFFPVRSSSIFIFRRRKKLSLSQCFHNFTVNSLWLQTYFIFMLHTHKNQV